MLAGSREAPPLAGSVVGVVAGAIGGLGKLIRWPHGGHASAHDVGRC